MNKIANNNEIKFYEHAYKSEDALLKEFIRYLPNYYGIAPNTTNTLMLENLLKDLSPHS